MITKTKSTLVLKADGTEQHVPNVMTLEQLRQVVGGYVTVTTCRYQGHKCQLVCNEDGRPMQLPYNGRATELFLEAQPAGCGDYMVGDVAVLINWKLA